MSSGIQVWTNEGGEIRCDPCWYVSQDLVVQVSGPFTFTVSGRINSNGDMFDAAIIGDAEIDEQPEEPKIKYTTKSFLDL